MTDLLRLLTLQDANTRVVLLGAGVLGLACGVIGAIAVLRRRALAGDAVAHAALPGVCFAFLIVGERNLAALLLGALVMGAVSVWFISLIKSTTRIKEDAATALAIGGFFGLGVVLLGVIQNRPDVGSRAGLQSFIFGKAAGMVHADVALITLGAAIVLVIVILLHKEFKALCFDSTFARGQGWPVKRLDFALMTLVCICTVIGLPAVGVVMVVALLIIPAVAARFWSDRYGHVLCIAGVIGALAGLLGTALSAVLPVPGATFGSARGWPTGPLIVIVASVACFASMLIAPGRGVLAAWLRQRELRRRIAQQNLLRDVYETLERTDECDLRRAWQPQTLVPSAGAGRGVSRRTLRAARRAGLIEPHGDAWTLTAHGQTEAARVVRAHRLWELFLIEQAQIAADHVDRDADEIEHVLPPSVIAQLEARLLAEHARRPQFSVPQSPHPVGESPAEQPPRPGRASRAPLWAIVTALGLVGAIARPAPAAIMSVDSASTLPLTLAVDPIAGWTIATAALCAVACAIVGSLLMLRRQALLGDAISHAILPGLVVAYLISGTRSPLMMLAGALAAGIITAVLSTAVTRSTRGRVAPDAAMGVVFTTMFALGVILISVGPRNVDLDADCVLYGLIELVPLDRVEVFGQAVPRAMLWLGVMALINLAFLLTFYKELKLLAFDEVLARTLLGSTAAAGLHYGLITLVTATSVASFEAVGSILVIAMLVAPPATAHLLTDRYGRMLVLSAIIAIASAVGGYVLAISLDTSVAGSIATTALALFVLAALCAPRGMIVRRFLRPPASPPG